MCGFLGQSLANHVVKDFGGVNVTLGRTIFNCEVVIDKRHRELFDLVALIETEGDFTDFLRVCTMQGVRAENMPVTVKVLNFHGLLIEGRDVRACGGFGGENGVRPLFESLAHHEVGGVVNLTVPRRVRAFACFMVLLATEHNLNVLNRTLWDRTLTRQIESRTIGIRGIIELFGEVDMNLKLIRTSGSTEVRRKLRNSSHNFVYLKFVGK